MGIYTSFLDRSYSDVNYDYTQVEPFVGEHFNYHALGIQVTTESMKNHNEFMKAIALGELASYEQYGTEEMFYEAINFGSIIDKVKAFFKKIIEKIHKIFHTFIAKMSSWFGGNRDFCNKYEKEVIKNWANVKNDWEFKGYNFENINSVMTKTGSEAVKTSSVTAKGDFKAVATLLNVNSATDFESALESMTKATVTPGTGKKEIHVLKSDESIEVRYIGSNTYQDDNTGKTYGSKQVKKKKVPATPNSTSYQEIPTGEELTKFRDDFNENGKDKFRGIILENLKSSALIQPTNIDLDDIRGSGSGNSLDQKEFTEELYKFFRKDEDSPTDLNKHDIETCYGSITAMMTFIKDYDKIKSNLEKAEKNMVKGIDDLIKALNSAENKVLKDKTDEAKSEGVVQFSSVFQTFWGFVKETQTQAFSSLLQAVKDACIQAKQIAVKVIGLNKKMTESYDYSSSYNNGFDFISSVKLV